MSFLKRLLRRIFEGKWVVRKCCWPYPEGYAVYNEQKRTIGCSGLTKEQAQHMCNLLNAL